MPKAAVSNFKVLAILIFKIASKSAYSMAIPQTGNGYLEQKLFRYTKTNLYIPHNSINIWNSLSEQAERGVYLKIIFFWGWEIGLESLKERFMSVCVN